MLNVWPHCIRARFLLSEDQLQINHIKFRQRNTLTRFIWLFSFVPFFWCNCFKGLIGWTSAKCRLVCRWKMSELFNFVLEKREVEKTHEKNHVRHENRNFSEYLTVMTISFKRIFDKWSSSLIWWKYKIWYTLPSWDQKNVSSEKWKGKRFEKFSLSVGWNQFASESFEIILKHQTSRSICLNNVNFIFFSIPDDWIIYIVEM